MSGWVVLPVVAPLAGAALSIGLGRWQQVQRAIGLVVLTVTTVVAVALLVHVDRDGPIAVDAGGWPAPVGITLVADRTALLLLSGASILLLVSLVYAIGHGAGERSHRAFHPMYLVLAAGVGLSFLTGDLFNLFVGFEMFLMASYVLLTLDGSREQVRRGSSYVVLGVLTSTLFLFALGFTYAAAGTVNLADLHTAFAEVPGGVRTGISVLFVVVFGMKAAVFPLFAWLPDSYPTAPTPVAAVFAGLLTKIGVYALLRTQTLMVPEGSRPTILLLSVAALTMIVGVLGAVARDDIRGLLSFHIVSQIGYAIVGIALFTVAGAAATLYFVLHQMAVKSSLFHVAGIVERRAGTTSLAALSGLSRVAPGLAVLFLLPALSLAGIPPLSGFVGKLAVVEAGFDAGSWIVTGVALAVGFLTLFSMTKIWAGAFWGDPDDGVALAPASATPGHTTMVAATSVLVAAGVALGLFAGPMFELCQRAGADLLDPSAYVREVLG
jgi:multicomponent Na+:H+ antiporter subunit D